MKAGANPGMTAASRDSGPSRNGALRLAAALWITAIVVILAHVWLKPNSNTLYKVFRAGGARWLAGVDLYPKVDEYIYSPFAAAFFAPFALLPDRIAGILWRLLSVGVYLGPFAAWLKRAPALTANRAAIAWILLLPLSVGDIYNGQANPLVIGLLMGAILACRGERWMVAALCVGVATYFKVYPLAMGLLLCVLHPRAFPWRLAFALVAIFAVSLVLQKPAYAWEQYGNWIHSLRQDPRRTLNYFGTYRDFWLILRVLRIPVSTQGWAVLQAVSGAGLAVYLWIVKRRGVGADGLDFLLLTLGTCWMLLFGPATESSTYVILAPALILAGLRWSGSVSVRGAYASYAFLIASQMVTSWAHQHQNEYTHLIQPIGALILAGTVFASVRNGGSGSDAGLAPGARVD
jgi:hypothetical protein